MLLNLLQRIKLQKRQKINVEEKEKDWHSKSEVHAHLTRRVYSAEGHKEQIWVMPALPVKLLMAPRRGMLCSKVSTALQGDEQRPGLPQFGREEMLCPHPTAKLWSEQWRAAMPGDKISLAFLSILFTGILRCWPLFFWPVMPICGFILASKKFPGASSNFFPKSSVAIVCSSFFSATHPERQRSKCSLSLSNGSGTFLRPFCAKGGQEETGRTGTKRGASIFRNSLEREKRKAPD